MQWKTKEGKLLEVKEMETSHIENCIKMLERKLLTKPPSSAYMGDSDTGNDWVEQENRANDEIEEMIDGVLKNFKLELKRRI